MKFEQIGNIVSIHKGKKHEITDDILSSSIRVLQIDDLRNDHLLKYTNDKKGVKANEEDLMIVWDGANAGTIGFGKSGYIGSTIAVLRKKQPGKYSTIFLGKFLQSQFSYLKKNTTGATIPHIDRKSLETLRIPVIGLDEQIHIANLLTKAENLITQRKESIRLLDEFLKSKFLEMFGSLFVEQNETYKTIASSCNFIDYRGKTLVRVSSGIPYISAKCVRQSYFDVSRIDYITEESYEKVMTRGFPKPNDVLFTTEGATMGFVCRIPRDFPNVFSVGQRIITLQCKESLNPEFLEFTLNNKEIQKQIFKRSSGSAAIGIRAAEFSEIKIPVPPIELQNQFAKIIEKGESLKIQYLQSFKELENLYGSLSQKAFRGELVFKDEELMIAAEPDASYLDGHAFNNLK